MKLEHFPTTYKTVNSRESPNGPLVKDFALHGSINDMMDSCFSGLVHLHGCPTKCGGQVWDPLETQGAKGVRGLS